MSHFSSVQLISLEDLNNAFIDASKTDLKGYLGIAHDGAVSVDLLGNPHSAIYDPFGASVIANDFVKVIAWYDNEYGYSSKLVELMIEIHNKN
jgi:glyceraldehyde 3-phosphate dehydrogenase